MMSNHAADNAITKQEDRTKRRTLSPLVAAKGERNVGFEEMKRIGTIFLLTTLLFQCGCGTLVMRSAGLRDELYPATQGDIIMIHGALDPDGTIFAEKSYILAGLTCIDVPVSLAFDTVLLPFDLMRRHSYRKKHPKKEDPTTKSTVPPEGAPSGVQ